MWRRYFAAIAVLLFVVLVFVLAWELLGLQRQAVSVVRKAIGKEEKQIDLTALVTEIRNLNRLETAAMRVMHVSTSRQSYGVVPDALTGDSLTFMGVGEVIAGIDLSRLGRDDIRLDSDRTIVLRLPPSEILVTRLDNRASKVINRETGVFRRSDVHLESRARAYSENGIRQEALKKGILSMASNNAELRLSSFLNKLGFGRVRFERSAIDPRRL